MTSGVIRLTLRVIHVIRKSHKVDVWSVKVDAQSVGGDVRNVNPDVKSVSPDVKSYRCYNFERQR